MTSNKEETKMETANAKRKFNYKSFTVLLASGMQVLTEFFPIVGKFGIYPLIMGIVIMNLIELKNPLKESSDSSYFLVSPTNFMLALLAGFTVDSISKQDAYSTILLLFIFPVLCSPTISRNHNNETIRLLAKLRPSLIFILICGLIIKMFSLYSQNTL